MYERIHRVSNYHYYSIYKDATEPLTKYLIVELLSQLKIGGKLLIPVGNKTQIMTLLLRKSAKEFEKHELGDFKFVPMLEKRN